MEATKRIFLLKSLAKVWDRSIKKMDRSTRQSSMSFLVYMDAVQKRRVTLLDIAADAGVSRATASLVIRNVPSVAETTRKRVLRSIKRLGYVYHSGAASLRTQRSNAVGLIVSDITNPFFAEASVAIEERLAASNYVTLLGNTSEDRAKEDRVLKTIREFPAEGILICPALEMDASGGASALAGRLPIVAFARRAPGLDYLESMTPKVRSSPWSTFTSLIIGGSRLSAGVQIVR